MLALKAVAPKLCRACYHIMKEHVAFDVDKAFALTERFNGWDGSELA